MITEDCESILDESSSAVVTASHVETNEEVKSKTEKSLNFMSMMAT